MPKKGKTRTSVRNRFSKNSTQIFWWKFHLAQARKVHQTKNLFSDSIYVSLLEIKGRGKAGSFLGGGNQDAEKECNRNAASF